MAKDPLGDLRNVMYLVWDHLNLPNPTPIQNDIALWLDKGPRRSMVMAFRGVAKSWISSVLVIKELRRDPNLNILVVSASKTRADDFTTFTKRLISEIPLFQHLMPREGQRDSKMAFDVGPAKAAHAPSVKSVGITGQLTGSRADLIIFDDVEVPNNSETQAMRDQLAERVKEAEAVLKPGGRIIFLGTPQCEDSVYNQLESRGYSVRIWPSEKPPQAILDEHGSRLSPYLAEKFEGEEEGEPTEPTRFNRIDLAERRLSYGNSGYALQFLLSTRLSDADRHPLKLGDLIVFAGDGFNAPERLFWGGGADQVIANLPCIGLRGDRWHLPLRVQGDFVPFQGSVMAIDPSGRGADETGYAVVNSLNGYLHVVACSGLRGGSTPENLRALADIAARHKVNEIIVESNFGDGMFLQLLTPHLRERWPVTTTEVRHSSQKEKRIIDVLEPVMNSHRLVVPKSLIESDRESARDLPEEMRLACQLFYQISRITKDRGSLRHDDRIDALAMAVQYWVQHMAVDVEANLLARKEELLQKDLDAFDEAWDRQNGGFRRGEKTWMRR